jgi:hypothetical protein
MSIRPSCGARTPPLVTFALASLVSLICGMGACKDPNPTFVFDAASDTPNDSAHDEAGQGGDAGGAGAGGAGGGGGGQAAGGAAGAGGVP